ncbi:MAG: response regulator [Gammaproteobacteria bacterium]|jgi:CheY-like chemotaxis protein
MRDCKNSFFTNVQKIPFFPIKNEIKILILDDCLMQQLFLQQLLLSQELTKSNISVKCVSSIDEALQYIESSNGLNLIISDIELANGKSGFDFVKKLKEYYKLENLTLPLLIAISSNDRYEKMALEAGFDAFLKKPLSEQDCGKILSQLSIEELNNESKPHLRPQ